MRRLALLTGLALLATGCQPDAQDAVLPTEVADATSQTAYEPGTEQSIGNEFTVSSAMVTTPTFNMSEPESPAGPLTANSSPAGGINPVVTESGFISLSVDGLGITSSSGTIQVDKPAGGTVRGAYIATASLWGVGPQANGAVTINGSPVNWDLVVQVNPPASQWSDVTSIVKPIVDAAAPGIVDLTITESGSIDGSVLAVIFDDPGQTTENTIALLFGGQKLAGDNFYLGLDEPLDKSDPGLVMDMSLGISFGYQVGSSGGQHSTIDVNGVRLTTSAGGQDDGAGANGALITVGGIGDTNANPSPATSFCGSGPRCDDELYNLVPILDDGVQQISVFTRNPSNDDNLFFAAFFLSVSAEVVTEDPVANAGPDQTVESDGLLPFAEVTVDGSGSFDPDGIIVSYQWFIDGNPTPFPDPSFTFLFDVGPHIVKLVVTDNDGLTDEDEAVITVNPPANLPPVPAIILNCPEPYYEGGDACLNGGPTFDPDDEVSTLRFVWDYDDGTTYEQLGVQGQPNHVYKDNGTYDVRLVVIDPQDAFGEAVRPTDVLNVAPTVDAGSGGSVPLGTAFGIDATFTDPGVLDAPWSWTVDWGDNTQSTGAVSDLNDHITPSHDYTAVGTYPVEVCVSDKDNGEGCASIQVEVTDATPPVITYELSGETGANGWYIGPVSVTWTVTDPESAITDDTCVPMTSDQDGAGQTFSCYATSAGGTTEVTTEAFDIDQTPPSVSVQLAGTPGSNGWFISDVTVDFTATDGTSGIDQDCDDVTVTGDGTGYQYSCTATDNAGLSASATSAAFMIDATAPSISYTVSGDMGNNGWYKSPVTVTWDVTDNLSGVASGCSAETFSQDGGGQTASCVATDAAGNQASMTTAPFDIDQLAPEVSYQLVGTPGSNGWFLSGVTVDWTVTDFGSGVSQDCQDVTVTADGVGYQYSCTATDHAGHSTTVTTETFKIDQTAPTAQHYVAGPGGDNGWYIGPVAVSWQVDDNLSGVLVDCPTEIFPGDGENQVATCSPVDKAGNTESYDSPSFKIDQTPPAVTYSGNAGTYDVTDMVSIYCTTYDAMSQVASSTCANIMGYGWDFMPGVNSYSAEATDRAGNEGYGETSFTVTASYDGLCSLVELWVSNKGVANSLCVKLAAAERAENRGNTQARNGSLGAFINELEAQSGKKIAADKADILIGFAEAMMN